MEYSNEKLNEIESLASKLLTPTQIGVLLDIEETEIRDDVNTVGHPARKAFMKGYIRTVLEMNQDVIDAAQAGSPFAQQKLESLRDNVRNELYV